MLLAIGQATVGDQVWDNPVSYLGYKKQAAYCLQEVIVMQKS